MYERKRQMTHTDETIDYAARVRRGAALLDRFRPGWAREIDCDRLAMESCDSCILGQLWGDYMDGFRELVRPLDSRVLFSAANHGFALFWREQMSPWTMNRFAALADAWCDEIRRRTESTV
jgi:hypothetical protein